MPYLVWDTVRYMSESEGQKGALSARIFPNCGRIAYVSPESERASASIQEDVPPLPRFIDCNTMDHFPTNWGRPVSIELLMSHLM